MKNLTIVVISCCFLVSTTPLQTCIPLYKQCGGIGYNGSITCCEQDAVCFPFNDFWWQCQDGIMSDCPQNRERRSILDPQTNVTHVVYALTKLKESGTYDMLTRLHANPQTFFDFHNNLLFLPWHRFYTYLIEDHVRQLGDEFRCFTLPYWDWSQEAGNESLSSVINMMGGLGNTSANDCIEKGPFMSWKDISGNCIRRVGDLRIRFASTIELSSIVTQTPTFSEFSHLLEQGPHSRPHLFVAGQMKTFAAPDDPLFWIHHSYVDFVFEQWRLCHNHSLPPQELIGVNMTYAPTSADKWWSVNVEYTYAPQTTLCRIVIPIELEQECQRLGIVEIPADVEFHSPLMAWAGCNPHPTSNRSLRSYANG